MAEAEHCFGLGAWRYRHYGRTIERWHFYTCPEDALDNRNGLGTPQVSPPTFEPWIRSDMNHHEEVSGQSVDGKAGLALARHAENHTVFYPNRQRDA
jgi:hypothetical protein